MASVKDKLEEMLIILWRPRDAVSFDCYPDQCYSFDMVVSEFVAWCRANGCKLRTKQVGICYFPDFRDEAAAELFRDTWMIEANHIEHRFKKAAA